MLKFGLDSYGQHLLNSSQYLGHRRLNLTSRPVYLKQHASHGKIMREHATVSCWVLSNPETKRQTIACTNLLSNYHFAWLSESANLSSQVTVSACPKMNPLTDLSFMNQGLNHFFDQEHAGRHISSKFCRSFYNLARNLSKQWR